MNKKVDFRGGVSYFLCKTKRLFLKQKYAIKRIKWKIWLRAKKLDSFSQDKQDLFVQYYYRNNENELFFVDVGANDGVAFSNTYALEKSAKWRGVLIEADSNVFKKLLENRPDPKIAKHNVALCDIDGEVSFMQITGYAQMLSGIIDEYDERHLERIKKEIETYGGSYEIIKMQSATFDTIMHNQPKQIDYLSIDIEGGEMKVLESIDFKKYDIRLIGVERNYNCSAVADFLKQNGYTAIMRVGCDDFYEKRI